MRVVAVPILTDWNMTRAVLILSISGQNEHSACALSSMESGRHRLCRSPGRVGPDQLCSAPGRGPCYVILPKVLQCLRTSASQTLQDLRGRSALWHGAWPVNDLGFCCAARACFRKPSLSRLRPRSKTPAEEDDPEKAVRTLPALLSVLHSCSEHSGFGPTGRNIPQ
jgi:hypothetical protein